MAAIDKTYLKWEDYLTLKEWCKHTELTYANGKKGSPKDFLYLYTEPFEGAAPVWNTPQAFDNWLYWNCPLSFIQERLKEQYSELPLVTVEECLIPLSTRYRVLEYPKAWFRFNDGCWIDCHIPTTEVFNGKEYPKVNYLMYGWDSHEWYDLETLMAPEILSSSYYCKYLSKRKFNRLIKKWKLPVGTIVKVMTRYKGVSFKVEMI